MVWQSVSCNQLTQLVTPSCKRPSVQWLTENVIDTSWKTTNLFVKFIGFCIWLWLCVIKLPFMEFMERAWNALGTSLVQQSSINQPEEQCWHQARRPSLQSWSCQRILMHNESFFPNQREDNNLRRYTDWRKNVKCALKPRSALLFSTYLSSDQRRKT